MYEVVCRCGRATRVTSVQAGLDIPCPCGESVEIPALSQLRQSALAAGRPIDPQPQRHNWTQWWRGVVMLVTGEAISLVSVLVSAAGASTSPVLVGLGFAGIAGGWLLALVGMVAIGRGKEFAMWLCLLLFFCVPFGRLAIIFVPGKGSDLAE